MSTPLEVRTENPTTVPTERLEVRELAAIVTRTLPGGGLDRMTASRVEEFLTPVALTAHL
ncbi:MAG: hypothetical protein ACRDRX_13075 [Pseudonocardiaceae bacterium]